MEERKVLNVKWEPEKNSKELTINFNNSAVKSKNNFIMEIFDIAELTDLNIEIEFYMTNYLRAKYKTHAFLGDNICYDQNVHVRKSVTKHDNDVSFLFDKIIVRIDRNISLLHFALK